MKKILSTTLVVVYILAQSAIAGAFVSDGTQGPFTAAVDLSGGTPVGTLSVAVKVVGTGAAATTLGWSGVNLGDGWKVSGQYLEVTYDANQIGWGVQIYTDNMATAANPKYAGDPTTDPAQQPAGLVGTVNTMLTCSMAILAYDSSLTATQLAIPVVAIHPTTGDRYFTTGYDEVAGGDHEITWFWLKDKSGTEWIDANTNGVIDAGEIHATFANGDDYATIVNTLGHSSGWVNAVSGIMQRGGASSPVDVYVAADFTNANELQEYRTNTLTLEIYHQ